MPFFLLGKMAEDWPWRGPDMKGCLICRIQILWYSFLISLIVIQQDSAGDLSQQECFFNKNEH